MSCKFLLLLCLSLCLILASFAAHQRRVGVLPTHFVGKGAYTLAAKRHQPVQQQQQQQQQQHKYRQQQQHQLLQQQQLQQRRTLFQWATMHKKLH